MKAQREWCSSTLHDAFRRLLPAPMKSGDRFLNGVPGADIKRIIDAAPGNEIASGKFDSPESSAALAVNVFGFFLHRPQDLPPLPGCPDTIGPARSLTLETTVRFPWRGGRHPVLDCLVATPSALIGIESKRYEPYRGGKAAEFSKAYWRPVWGERMKGYERVRDLLRENPHCYAFLDAAQLVKHAFGLRTEVNGPGSASWPEALPLLRPCGTGELARNRAARRRLCDSEAPRGDCQLRAPRQVR